MKVASSKKTFWDEWKEVNAWKNIRLHNFTYNLNFWKEKLFTELNRTQEITPMAFYI